MPQSPTAPAGPVGAWEVKTAQATFRLVLKEDGTGTFNGQAMRWQFNQGHLIVVAPDGSTEMFQASLTPTSLTIKGASLPQPVIFQRLGSEAGGEGIKAESSA